MTKTKTKTCQNCKAKFIIEPEDFEFYKKIDVPEPTFCPECRTQRRLVLWNSPKVYKRKCDFSGKEIFSSFSSKAPARIYDQKIWNSDKWDAMEYKKDYNFKKPFFEQIRELTKKVPYPSRVITDTINCDYCNNVNGIKNGYLLESATNSEDCAYSYRVHSSRDSYDCIHLNSSELCYQGFMLDNCYKSFFSSHCEDSQEIIACQNCINCQNCFGCTNLRHKRYHIFNKSYTKKEYFKKLEEFDIGNFINLKRMLHKINQQHLNYPKKFMFGRHNVNVAGEYIYNSKNIFDSYSIRNGENLRYCQFLDAKVGAKDVYDQTGFGINAQNTYECNGVGEGVNNVKFSWHCFPECLNIEYCIECRACSDLFGCSGLKHKQYCILKKQYTKEQYEQMIPKIKKHMNDMPYINKKGRVYKYGEFFPIDLSPFAYNETIANEYFPLTKQQALEQGYTWYDKPKNEYKPTIKAIQLPDNIKDTDDSILKEVIECENVRFGVPALAGDKSLPKGRTPRIPEICAGSSVFRLIPQELKFYKKMNLSLPRLCPDCRHRERIKQRNPMKLWERQCMNKGCPNEFQTTYAPDRKEIVYCESCYNKEIG